MGVKKLISFYENQHFFTLLFVHNFLSRCLNESFRHFCMGNAQAFEACYPEKADESTTNSFSVGYVSADQ